MDRPGEHVRSLSEIALQPSGDVGEIACTLSKPGIALPGEHQLDLFDGSFERPVCVDPLGSHQLVGAAGEQRVVQHEHLGCENGGLGRTERPRHP